MDSNKTRRYLAVGPAMVVPFFGALVYFVLFSKYYFARAVYGAVKVFTVVWPVFCIYYILPRATAGRRRSPGEHLRSIPLGILTGLALAGVMFALMASPVGDIVRAGADNIQAKASQLGVTEHYWPFAMALSLVNSLVEEYYWRWFLYGQLRTLTPTYSAHLLAAAAFASHHIVVTCVFFGPVVGVLVGASVGLGGLIWSTMYQRQSTILGAWVSHVFVDLGVFAIGHNLLFGSYL